MLISLRYKKKLVHTNESEGGLTCEWVNKEADDHCDDGDESPVREPLVLHAAIDSNGGLMALQEKYNKVP